MSEWNDDPVLNDEQARLLRILHHALLEIRAEAWQKGSTEPFTRIAALAQLVHNIPPALLKGDRASLRELEQRLPMDAKALGLHEWLAARYEPRLARGTNTP
jgi:hypothetical protein